MHTKNKGRGTAWVIPRPLFLVYEHENDWYVLFCSLEDVGFESLTELPLSYAETTPMVGRQFCLLLYAFVICILVVHRSCMLFFFFLLNQLYFSVILCRNSWKLGEFSAVIIRIYSETVFSEEIIESALI